MEHMGEGVVVLVIGMSIVFLVLITLWAILLGFEKIFGSPKKKKAEPKKEVAPVLSVEKPMDDEEEIVAVITAAICAMTGQTASSFKINKIKRISNWNK